MAKTRAGRPPEPKIHRGRWRIRIRVERFVGGVKTTPQVCIDLGNASEVSLEDARKRRDEELEALNEGRRALTETTTLDNYVKNFYIPTELPQLAATTRERYLDVIDKYLLPQFGKVRLCDLRRYEVQQFFVGLKASTKLARASRLKIRNVLSAIFETALANCRELQFNPVRGVKIKQDEVAPQEKQWIRQEQFEKLLALIPEPYATMIYVAIYTGSRVSELCALKWNDIVEVEQRNPEDGTTKLVKRLRIDERYCRGDWSVPKSIKSRRKAPLKENVLERIEALKHKSVGVKSGRAGIIIYKLVKSSEPNDLIFQSVRKGVTMRDGNILRRFIKPAARALGLDFVSWHTLRHSFDEWVREYEKDLRVLRDLMGHATTQITADVYLHEDAVAAWNAVDRVKVVRELTASDVVATLPAAQRKAAAKLSHVVRELEAQGAIQ